MRKSFILFCIVVYAMPLGLYAASQKHLTQKYGNYLKAFIHFEEGNLAQSLEEFEAVRKLDPDSIYVRLKIAFLLVKLGELEKAEAELRDIKNLDDENLEASLGLIFLYSHIGKEDMLEAEYGEFLEKAHKLRPEDIKISEYLAQFYFYKKRLDDAIKIYETIVATSPDYTDARYLLGYFYEEKGKRAQAIETWKKLLEIEPLHADALNSLGYIYAEAGTNLDEALELVSKALEQDAENGAYLDSLGWVYFKKKEYEKAKEYLLKAVELIQDPVVYGHLGDLFIEMNDIPLAVKYYKKGVELAPEDTELKEKLKKYEKQEDIAPQEESKQSTETDN